MAPSTHLTRTHPWTLLIHHIDVHLAMSIWIGIGTAIQPLISYYHGAKNCQRERQTVQIAVRTAIVAGVLSFLVGLMAARPIVAIFGDFPQDIMALAVTGVRLFFIAYLFMGVNFVMMT